MNKKEAYENYTNMNIANKVLDLTYLIAFGAGVYSGLNHSKHYLNNPPYEIGIATTPLISTYLISLKGRKYAHNHLEFQIENGIREEKERRNLDSIETSIGAVMYTGSIELAGYLVGRLIGHFS